MNTNIFMNQIEQVGVGVAFILFLLIFVFAFAVHPNLLKPRLLGPEGLIRRARNNWLLHFGHVLVTLSTGLLIVIALQFMKLIEESAGAWTGFIGGAIAILGAVFLAVDKGALCLTMSAFDTLPEKAFEQICRVEWPCLQKKAGYGYCGVSYSCQSALQSKPLVCSQLKHSLVGRAYCS